jgi:hypothetical protein
MIFQVNYDTCSQARQATIKSNETRRGGQEEVGWGGSAGRPRRGGGVLREKDMMTMASIPVFVCPTKKHNYQSAQEILIGNYGSNFRDTKLVFRSMNSGIPINSAGKFWNSLTVREVSKLDKEHTINNDEISGIPPDV